MSSTVDFVDSSDLSSQPIALDPRYVYLSPPASAQPYPPTQDDKTAQNKARNDYLERNKAPGVRIVSTIAEAKAHAEATHAMKDYVQQIKAEINKFDKHRSEVITAMRLEIDKFEMLGRALSNSMNSRLKEFEGQHGLKD